MSSRYFAYIEIATSAGVARERQYFESHNYNQVEVDMNLFKRGFLVMTCSLMAGLNQPGLASNATATLDWSQLQVSVLGIDGAAPTVTFSGQRTDLSSTALIPDQINENNAASVFDWTTTLDTNAQARDTFANTLGSPLVLSGNAKATEAIAGPGHVHLPVEALSFGRRSEDFSLDGPGVLTASIPYTISIMGGQPFNFFDAAAASVSGNASFSSSANNGSASSTSSVSFGLSSFEIPSPQSQSGNLVFGIVASGPGAGSFDIGFNLSTQAPLNPIPEPGSYVLLLAGLGLIGAIARRRTIIMSPEQVG